MTGVSEKMSVMPLLPMLSRRIDIPGTTSNVLGNSNKISESTVESSQNMQVSSFLNQDSRETSLSQISTTGQIVPTSKSVTVNQDSNGASTLGVVSLAEGVGQMVPQINNVGNVSKVSNVSNVSNVSTGRNQMDYSRVLSGPTYSNALALNKTANSEGVPVPIPAGMMTAGVPVPIPSGMMCSTCNTNPATHPDNGKYNCATCQFKEPGVELGVCGSDHRESVSLDPVALSGEHTAEERLRAIIPQKEFNPQLNASVSFGVGGTGMPAVTAAMNKMIQGGQGIIPGVKPHPINNYQRTRSVVTRSTVNSDEDNDPDYKPNGPVTKLPGPGNSASSSNVQTGGSSMEVAGGPGQTVGYKNSPIQDDAAGGGPTLRNFHANDERIFGMWSPANHTLQQMKKDSPPLGEGIVFTSNGAIMTPTDCRDLALLDKPLSDNTIKAIAELVRSRCDLVDNTNIVGSGPRARTAKNTNVFLIPHAYGDKTHELHDDENRLIEELSAKVTNDTKRIFAFVKVNPDGRVRSHVFVVVIDLSDSTKPVYRLIETYNCQRKVVMTFFRDFLQSHFSLFRPETKERKWNLIIHRPSETPMQSKNDEVNGGLYACMLVDLYTQGIPVNEMKNYVNHRNINEIRSRMCVFLTGFNYRFVESFVLHLQCLIHAHTYHLRIDAIHESLQGSCATLNSRFARFFKFRRKKILGQDGTGVN
jgi:hypothetical protein